MISVDSKPINHDLLSMNYARSYGNVMTWKRNYWKLKKNCDSLKNSNIFHFIIESIVILYSFFSEENHQNDDDDEKETDAAVQGPIPLEPEEKLYGYKRDDSKVRQL